MTSTSVSERSFPRLRCDDREGHIRSLGGWKQRTTCMRADAAIPVHRFGSWTSPDEFVPYLQPCFVPSDDLDALIKISGNLVDTSEVRVQDDGVSQECPSGRARHARPKCPYRPRRSSSRSAPSRKSRSPRTRSCSGSSPARWPASSSSATAARGSWKPNIRTWLLENLPEGVKVIA